MNTETKTFRAADPRAALSLVKAALGDEAIIVETREVRTGIWSKPLIEVTAARPAPNPSVPAMSSPLPLPMKAPPGPDLQQELAALRRTLEEMRLSLRTDAPATPSTPSPLRPGAGRAHLVPQEAIHLFRKLINRGVEEGIAEDLVRQVLRQGTATAPGDVLAEVKSQMRRRLLTARPPWEGTERRVVALVGPTGVGKTTTIAKIAARALLASRQKVALITVDTYRIGACEQLARYGEIMNVPTQVARDSGALQEALFRVRESDLVLIDTAGRSDPEAIAAQAALLRSVNGVQVHLVLSAAAGAREMAAAARRYRAHEPDRLIFSKLDEAEGPGSVLSALSSIPRPLSCATNGQKVPDDLHSTATFDLVDLILGN